MPRKKTAAQLDQDIAEFLGPSVRDGWTRPRVRKGWPETWEKHLRAWWYTLEKQPSGRWAVGFSHQRGDSDSIIRGSTFATWEAAAKFAEEHAR